MKRTKAEKQNEREPEQLKREDGKPFTLDDLDERARAMDVEEACRAGIAPDPAAGPFIPIPDTSPRALVTAFDDLDNKQIALVIGAQPKILVLASIAAGIRTDLIDEMVQVGTIAACKAADRYDEKRAKFTTFISLRVSYAMLDFRWKVMRYEQRFGPYSAPSDGDRNSGDRISVSFLLSAESELMIDRPVCPQSVTERTGEVEHVMGFLVGDGETDGARIVFYALEHNVCPAEAGRALHFDQAETTEAIRLLRKRFEGYSQRARTARERSIIGRNRAAIVDRWRKVIL